MTDSLSKTDRQRQHRNKHARLAELFITDRFAFELERKRLIEENLKSLSCPRQRARAEELQKKLDCILQGAGSEHNRFVMMQMLFWDHVHNVLIPALNACRQKPGRPSLYLVENTPIMREKSRDCQIEPTNIA